LKIIAVGCRLQKTDGPIAAVLRQDKMAAHERSSNRTVRIAMNPPVGPSRSQRLPHSRWSSPVCL